MAEEKLLTETIDRIKRLTEKWRAIGKIAQEMVDIYNEEDSETKQYIDDCVSWTACHRSLDEWTEEISWMVDNAEHVIEEGTVDMELPQDGQINTL